MGKILYWLPRVLSILLTLFWFGFVILSHGLSIDSLIESVVWVALLISTIIAWKYEYVGGVIFILLGLLYTFLVFNKFSFLVILIVTGPLFLTGVLYILDKRFN